MKRLTLTIALFLTGIVLCRYANAQITSSDCLGAIPVCQNIYVSNVAPVNTGGIADLTIDNQDCLSSGEHLTAWYLINVISSGTLVFTITPPTPADYDFALWDITGDPTVNKCTPTGCDNIKNALPVRCNYSGTIGQTGLSATGTCASCNAGDPPFSTALNVTAGQTLILVVDNFTTNTSGYTLDFTGSTASIFDQQEPKYQSVTTKCGFESNILEVNMSELVTCASIDGDGSDFYITPNPGNVGVVSAVGQYCGAGAQFTSNITLTLSNALQPGSYILNARRGGLGNALIDACQNEQLQTDGIAFTIQENPNPLGVQEMSMPACIKTRIVLTQLVKCNSISPDGSDFIITGPGNVKVISATSVGCREVELKCSKEIMTDTIDIVFDKSIFTPGTYTLSVGVGNDLNGLLDTCGSSAFKPFEFEVTDKEGIDVTSATNIMCEPGYTYLNTKPLLPPSVTGYGFKWLPSLFVGDTTKANTLVYVPKTTTYTMQVKDEDECYRRDTITIIVSELKPMLGPHRDTTICIGEAFKMKASGGVTYAWSPAEGISCIYCPEVTVMPEVTTDYTLTVTDQYGCYKTLPLHVQVDPLPFVDAGIDTSVLYGDKIMLYAYAPGGLMYVWTPIAGLSNPNDPNTYAAPQEATTYTVIVADTNGCINKDTVLVKMREKSVLIPGAFSPNGDGRNDVFRIANLSYERVLEFRVFNRWGQQVFSAQGSNAGWDGNFKGNPAEVGVYQYLIRVGKPDGNSNTYRGDITLIR